MIKRIPHKSRSCKDEISLPVGLSVADLPLYFFAFPQRKARGKCELELPVKAQNLIKYYLGTVFHHADIFSCCFGTPEILLI